MKAIITIGVPASGKTTYANEFISNDPSFTEINRDNIRRELFKINGWTEYEFTSENERKVTTAQYDLIRQYSVEKRNIIITDTNLKMKYIRSIISLLEHFGYDVSIKICDISFIEVLRRNYERSVGIDAVRLQNQYDQFVMTKERVKQKYKDYIIS